jgi:hypothetical protein
MICSLLFTIFFIHASTALTCNVRVCLRTYTVVGGDYLSLIAQKNRVSVANLQRCNPEALTTILFVGQQLCISCSINANTCTCSNFTTTRTGNTWLSIADSQKMTIGYLSDCNPTANIATTLTVPNGLNICVKCRISGRAFTISPYYEAVVATLNANLGRVSTSGLKAATFAFITGSGSGTNAVPSWEGTSLITYLTTVTGFAGAKTISFGGSEAGAELAIKFVAANGNATQLAAKYNQIAQTFGSSITFDFDIEGSDVANVAANTLRSKAMKITLASYPRLKVTYTLAVGPSGLTSDGIALIRNSISNGVLPSAVNIMTMNYGASSRGLDFDVKAIEAAYLQLVGINNNIRLGVTPMIGKDDSGAIRTIADIDSLLTFSTTKPSIVQFGYWAYHRDIPGTVGVSPCLTLAYCAGITGFTKGGYKSKFLSFSS